MVNWSRAVSCLLVFRTVSYARTPKSAQQRQQQIHGTGYRKSGNWATEQMGHRSGTGTWKGQARGVFFSFSFFFCRSGFAVFPPPGRIATGERKRVTRLNVRGPKWVSFLFLFTFTKQKGICKDTPSTSRNLSLAKKIVFYFTGFLLSFSPKFGLDVPSFFLISTTPVEHAEEKGKARGREWDRRGRQRKREKTFPTRASA